MSDFDVMKSEPMSAAELKEHINLIQEVTRSIMKSGTHYDKIPGTDKPSLLKPGADTLCVAFKLNDEPAIESETDGFDYSFKVTCRLFHIPTGNTVGFGVGCASTRESKYMWRAAVCQDEFNDTPESKRRVHYEPLKDSRGYKIKSKDGVGFEFARVLQIRQNPEDIKNTVLKMAKKRAKIDATISSTGCSDMFVQDIEDPDTAEAAGIQPPRYQQPQRRQSAPQSGSRADDLPENGNVISDAQRKRLYEIGKGRGLSDEEMSFIVFEVSGVGRSREVPRDRYDAVVAAFESATSGSVIPSEA